MPIDTRSLTIFAVLVGLIMAMSVLIAKAEHEVTYRPAYIWNPHEWREVRHRRQTRKVWREPQRQTDDGRCRPFLAVVGDQYASETGAKGEADKAWMQTARWQWGERYMAREHADDATYECGRSSVGSVVGQVFYRCRLSARPCRPESQRGDR